MTGKSGVIIAVLAPTRLARTSKGASCVHDLDATMRRGAKRTCNDELLHVLKGKAMRLASDIVPVPGPHNNPQPVTTAAILGPGAEG